MKINIKRADIIILSMLLFYPAIHHYIWRVLTIVTNFFGFHFLIRTFDTFVWLIIAIVTLPVIIKRLDYKPLIAYAVLVLVSVFSWVFTDYQNFTMRALGLLIFTTIPIFIYGAVIKVDEESHDILYKMALLTLGVSIFYSAYYLISGRVFGQDNMEFAYNILPSVLIIVSKLFCDKKRSIAAIVFSVIGVVFLVLQGTRGPVLCLIAFVCLMIYKYFGFKKALILFCIAALIFTLLFALQASGVLQGLLKKVGNGIESMGFSSRIIDMLASKKITDSSGRNIIMDRLFEDIKNDPIGVRGLFADRQATIGLHNSDSTLVFPKGTYAHSLWLELIYDFGLIIGLGIFIYLVIMVVRLIFVSDKSVGCIPLLFITIGFIYLFFSGSFLIDKEFFFLTGLFYNPFIFKRKPSGENSADLPDKSDLNDLSA